MTSIDHRSLPFLMPEYCKGCGRCVASCTKDCISLGAEINPVTGLVPVVLDLERCNLCGLCIDACPEPFGLRPEAEREPFELVDPAHLFGPRPFDAPTPEPSGAVIELLLTDGRIRYLLNSEALAAQNLRPTPGLLENALRRPSAVNPVAPAAPTPPVAPPSTPPTA